MAKKIDVAYERGFKSQFVREVLASNPHASVNDVNQAWTAAGHDGRLGDTLIYKTKSEVSKSPSRTKTLPLDSHGSAASRIELKPEPPRSTADADVRGLVVEELRQRIKSASVSELVDLLNALGMSPSERASDPKPNGSN